MPELWLWHVPEWRLGTCDWIAYDESGFALGSGLIDVGKEAIAEEVAAKENVACSHGMPTSSIERDPVDPTVIVKHITTEISLLPYERAANKLTGFVLLGSENKEEGSMAIPTKKREQLIDGWGVDATLLDKLEAMNEADAAKAREEGREYKEAETEDVAASESTADAAQDAAVQDESHDEQTPYPTRQEIADAFETIMQPYVETVTNIQATLDELTKQVGEVKKDDEEKIKEQVDAIPAASLAALITQRISAVGAKETQIDGRSSLAKAGPKETPADEEHRIRIGVPFLDTMLNDKTPAETET